MIVDLDKLDEAFEYYKKINSTEMKDLVWLRGNTVIPVSEEDIKHWKFTGLGNYGFYEFGGLKEK